MAEKQKSPQVDAESINKLKRWAGAEMTNTELVLLALASGPATLQQLMAQTQLPYRNVVRCLNNLAKQERAAKSPVVYEVTAKGVEQIKAAGELTERDRVAARAAIERRHSALVRRRAEDKFMVAGHIGITRRAVASRSPLEMAWR